MVSANNLDSLPYYTSRAASSLFLIFSLNPKDGWSFKLFRRLTINQTSGITPPTVNKEPPTIRSHVSVWNSWLLINERLLANHNPCSVTVLNCKIPAGNRSRNTISSKPPLTDQKMVRMTRGFQESALNSNWQQNKTAANARFPYTPISAAWPWLTVK